MRRSVIALLTFGMVLSLSLHSTAQAQRATPEEIMKTCDEIEQSISEVKALCSSLDEQYQKECGAGWIWPIGAGYRACSQLFDATAGCRKNLTQLLRLLLECRQLVF